MFVIFKTDFGQGLIVQILPRMMNGLNRKYIRLLYHPVTQFLRSLNTIQHVKQSIDWSENFILKLCDARTSTKVSQVIECSIKVVQLGES